MLYGFNIDFQVANETLLLIHYLSHFDKPLLFTFELGSAFPGLKNQNLSNCSNSKTGQTKLPPKKVVIMYAA